MINEHYLVGHLHAFETSEKLKSEERSFNNLGASLFHFV